MVRQDKGATPWLVLGLPVALGLPGSPKAPA